MRVLFTAISGTNTSEALSKIASSLYPDKPIKIVKFEKYLIKVHELNLKDLNFASDYIEKEIKRINGTGGIQILLQHPKKYIRETWIKAFNLMNEETKNYENAFFSMHSVYYQTQNREFFAAYCSESINKFNVDNVITLVDDIYDSHARLREENGVMSDSSREQAYPDRDERARARINDLFSILDWRSKEIMAAEQIASLLNKRHFVIAVKHPIEVIKSLLIHDALPIYISHPITQVRRLISQNRINEAADIKKQISELALEFIYKYTEKVTAIFPTTIDELIIEKTTQFPFSAPKLAERWSLIEDPDKLIYCKPELLRKNPLDIEEIYYNAEGEKKRIFQVNVSVPLGS